MVQDHKVLMVHSLNVKRVKKRVNANSLEKEWKPLKKSCYPLEKERKEKKKWDFSLEKEWKKSESEHEWTPLKNVLSSV